MIRRIVLLGPPASGKGTQATLIERQLGIPPISPGSLLREELAAGTPLGRAAGALWQEGHLVPDDTILQLVEARIEKLGDAFLLDGVPRTIPQAEALLAFLEARGTPLETVLLLELPEDALRARAAGRMVCAGCRATFGRDVHGLGSRADCPACGGRLDRRTDDAPDRFEVRLREYRLHTAPLVPHFERLGLLHRLPPAALAGDPDTLFACIRAHLCSASPAASTAATLPR